MLHGLVAPIINFSLLVILLAYLLREPMKTFVSTRHTSLKNEVDTVRAQLSRARTQFTEFNQKLSQMDREITELKAQVKSDAEQMHARVLAEAKKSAQSIVTDSRASVDGIFGDLKTQLRTDLANRVVERAEAILRSRLTNDDRTRIRQEFSRQVGSAR